MAHVICHCSLPIATLKLNIKWRELNLCALLRMCPLVMGLYSHDLLMTYYNILNSRLTVF